MEDPVPWSHGPHLSPPQHVASGGHTGRCRDRAQRGLGTVLLQMIGFPARMALPWQSFSLCNYLLISL